MRRAVTGRVTGRERREGGLSGKRSRPVTGFERPIPVYLSMCPACLRSLQPSAWKPAPSLGGGSPSDSRARDGHRDPLIKEWGPFLGDALVQFSLKGEASCHYDPLSFKRGAGGLTPPEPLTEPLTRGSQDSRKALICKRTSRAASVPACCAPCNVLVRPHTC